MYVSACMCVYMDTVPMGSNKGWWYGAEEVGQRLRTLAVLSEALDFSALYLVPIMPILGDLMPFAFLGHLHACNTQ